MVLYKIVPVRSCLKQLCWQYTWEPIESRRLWVHVALTAGADREAQHSYDVDEEGNGTTRQAPSSVLRSWRKREDDSFVLSRPFSHRFVRKSGRSQPVLHRSPLP